MHPVAPAGPAGQPAAARCARWRAAISCSGGSRPGTRSCRSLLARLMRKPSVVVIGGFDTARLPRIGYGLQQRGAMRPRQPLGDAPRDPARDELPLQPRGGGRERRPRPGTGDGRLPRRAGSPSASCRRVAAGARRADGRLRRSAATSSARACGPSCEAAAHLPDVAFVLAGRWDDASADELRDAAPPNVTLTGWVEQEVLNEHMRRASVYVQASAHEGFGMSVAEAMLAGCIPVDHARGRAARGGGRRRGAGGRRGPAAARPRRSSRRSTMDDGRAPAGAAARARALRRSTCARRGLQQVVAEALERVVSAPDRQPLQRHPDAARPQAMRQAMAHAEVGDEQRLADPTVNALQERVAELLGHEAALFLPSGTMCNAIAFRLHVRPGGDEVILDRTSHPVPLRGGRPGGAVGRDAATGSTATAGIFTAATGGGGGAAGGRPLRPALAAGVGRADHQRRRRARVAARRRSARCSTSRARHGLRTHLDGARLMNAVVASGVPAADFAGGFDTAWVDFTKGLGAPVGAVLAGVAGADRRGLALQADDGRRDAPGGDPGRRRACTRSTTTSSASPRTTRTRARSPRASRSCPASTSTSARVETNIVVFGVPDAFGLCGDALRSEACRSRRSARGGCARSPTSTWTPTTSTARSRYFVGCSRP